MLLLSTIRLTIKADEIETSKLCLSSKGGLITAKKRLYNNFLRQEISSTYFSTKPYEKRSCKTTIIIQGVQIWPSETVENLKKTLKRVIEIVKKYLEKKDKKKAETWLKIGKKIKKKIDALENA